MVATSLLYILVLPLTVALFYFPIKYSTSKSRSRKAAAVSALVCVLSWYAYGYFSKSLEGNDVFLLIPLLPLIVVSFCLFIALLIKSVFQKQ